MFLETEIWVQCRIFRAKSFTSWIADFKEVNNWVSKYILTVENLYVTENFHAFVLSSDSHSMKFRLGLVQFT